MAPLSIIGALSALPLALAHMQMSSPSPLRDPHATDRPDEPKDYNILNPLNADGSNFACKGYHLNTPLTTVATYEAGSKQKLRLKGSATHGGGSCQISLSCNGGDDFNVIKSIIGGCPLSDSYDFTIPSDIPPAKKCLLAWTWFNRIGNREMYMNCAVVDITNKRRSKRDTQVSAASALSRYPELFVANLANINSCRIQEITDVIFDNPGKSVVYGNGDNASMKPTFKRGQCTGKPSKNAGSKDTSSSNSGGGNNGQWSAPSNSGGGNNGQWNAPSQSSSSSNSDPNGCKAKISSGKYFPECDVGYKTPANQQPQQQQQQQQQPQQRPQQQRPQAPNRKKPHTRVQQELDAYLATLYGRGLARRDATPGDDYDEGYSPKKEYPASPHKHVHGQNCKHKTTGYPYGSHYDAEDEDSYSEDHDDYSQHSYSNKKPQYHEDPDYAYKRVARERRWTSYNKREDVPAPAPSRAAKKYFRGPASEYVQQAPNQAAAAAPVDQVSAEIPKHVSTEASTQTPKEVSSQGSTDASNHVSAVELHQASTNATAQAETQASSESPAAKVWNDMTEAEKFDAFLRRMVELSSNMYSLVKYASASTVNLPWYPPASTYDRAPATDASTQYNPAVHRLARRGSLAAHVPAQVYPGPSVGSISAPGDATDADAGFEAWFPHLVPGLTKRQLIDPVTSEASAEANSSVGFFDALAAGFWKLFGDPFSYYGNDDSEDDNDDSDAVLEEPEATDASDIPILLGEPVNSSPDFPDFEIPDLDGHYIFPPQILAPEPPHPELMPDYEEGPNGPVWVGDGPEPLTDAFTGPTIIVTIEPLDSDTPAPDFFPGDDPDLPLLSNTCVEPIPQLGFNSCWGGCNHTVEEIAAHDAYLAEFAKQQDEYEECLQSQGPVGHGSYWHNDDEAEENDEADWRGEAEDASGRRPRPGWSQPMIPAEEGTSNSTVPSPLPNSTADAVPMPVPIPVSDVVPTPDEETIDILPYQNKTLGELVQEITQNPGLLDAPESIQEEEEEITNPLQQAADLAEEGVTVPSEPVEINPSQIESIADALPWLLGPGPVLNVPPQKNEDAE